MVGLDKQSSRESFASLAYDKGYAVPWLLHAAHRIKHLFSQIFGYAPSVEINYGIEKNKLISPVDFLKIKQRKFLIFLHGTTWQSKHWPEKYWQRLIYLVASAHPEWQILLPWGSLEEKDRAERLSRFNQQVRVLPKLSIGELAYYITQAQSVVAVDTGLGHLSAALGAKTINLYGSTDPNRTGTVGENQVHLAASQIYPCAPCLKRKCIYTKQEYPPCYKLVMPEMVLKNLAL